MDVVSISAVTLGVSDIARSVAFYRCLGFTFLYGGEQASFTSFRVGTGYLNLIASPGHRNAWWGRVILRVTAVDAWHRRCLDQGLSPLAPPADAPWGERFFHLTDPDGHELSFAQLLG